MAHQFFLLAIATTMAAIFLLLSPPTAASSPVVDMDGNPLEVGSQYYVLTAGTRGRGRGGLTYMSKPPLLCPTYVGQHGFWMMKGRPVSLYPSNSSLKQIIEGDDVNIAFGGPNYCRNAGVWRMMLDNETMISYVSTDGDMGGSGSETSASWFKIEKAFGNEQVYKIVYCFEHPEPAGLSIMGGKGEICKQLDATQPGLNDISFLSLVPIDYPLFFFGFVFQKAVTPTTTTTTSY